MRFGVSLSILALWAVVGGFGFSLAQTPASEGQVEIQDVTVLMSQMGPVVLLKAQNRVVPIFVDPTVAGSIDSAIRGTTLSRPLSHDLMRTILREFGGTVLRANISLKGEVYYGELEISIEGNRKVFDSRSSDAIALAIHFQAPIYVDQSVLDQATREESANRDMPPTL
ncbi:bifunctional nuclease family protein [Candidatus Nitronereus thalassa]|uniref:Bifunctional nuclease family protein n=1 Tax=Candidatus Nitronereus thalassa TaxID=3020898 RepID=A0ABU3KCF6_9BACT|nr:bifunctional nuclease family protein [Candidatus Nitronereus thalassa]MDT7044195.1 bifunctional nuclease family protein [Candidatus Nitronereus thalassa]